MTHTRPDSNNDVQQPAAARYDSVASTAVRRRPLAAVRRVRHTSRHTARACNNYVISVSQRDDLLLLEPDEARQLARWLLRSARGKRAKTRGAGPRPGIGHVASDSLSSGSV